MNAELTFNAQLVQVIQKQEVEEIQNTSFIAAKVYCIQDEDE